MIEKTIYTKKDTVLLKITIDDFELLGQTFQVESPHVPCTENYWLAIKDARDQFIHDTIKALEIELDKQIYTSIG